MNQRKVLTGYEELRKQRIRPLLKLNDNFRTLAASEADINVTTIVVVGDQSHGKTSILEALSGIDLPRGDGIVTRVPLVLKMRELLGEGGGEEEYAILKTEGREEKHIKLSAVASEVTILTSELAGDGAGVVEATIELTVYRKEQDDLTLIDLPGMTRVPVRGQAENIEETITKMYTHFMRPNETILLNVVSAMVDFSTSKSLSMSRKLDPEGARTLLCVSKIDQHKESGLAKIMKGVPGDLKIPCEHVFCVRNRTQKENEERMTLDAVRTEEMSFFASSELDSLSPSSKGVNAVSAKLVELQFERIKATLPIAASKFLARLRELEEEDSTFGVELGTEHACRATVQRHLLESLRVLADEAKGRTQTMAEDHSSLLSQQGEASVSIHFKDLAATRGSIDFKATERSEPQQAGPFGVTLEVRPFSGREPTEGVAITSTTGSDEKTSGFAIQKSTGKSVGFSSANGHVKVGKGDMIALSLFNKEYRKSHGLSAFVEVKAPSATKSFKAEAMIEARAKNGDLIETRELNFNNSECYGYSQFLTSEKASTYADVTFQATVFVSGSLSVNAGVGAAAAVEPKHSSPLLCTTVFQRDQDFATAVNHLFPNRHFFSDDFREMVKREIDRRRGSAGLPGALVPEPAIAIIGNMIHKLFPLVKQHVDSVSAIALDVSTRITTQAIGSYPELSKVILSAVTSVFKDQQRQAHAMTQQVLWMEMQQIHSSNHYFMDTVQDLRKYLKNPEAEKIQKFSFISQEKRTLLKGLSNEDQRDLDLCIEIFAYWKMLKKRFIDYIQMMARSYLLPLAACGGGGVGDDTASMPDICLSLEELLSRKIHKAVDEATQHHGGYLELMQPDNAKRQARALIRQRITNMKEALKQYHDYEEATVIGIGTSGY
mmetsp:Transcript_63843/g.128307  ORF Transcript_63843/g.128307 Transcript_63843/m.128307 type:complete len:890 (-) Transcript_63843:212-2881(-)